MKKSVIVFVMSLLVWTSAEAQLTRIDSASYFTSFDGVRIHYEVKGFGEPVLLVHGFIVDGESWKRTALYNDLLVAGYKVITLDLRGNGKSDKPHQPESYQQDAEAKDIMALITRLNIKQYDAVGYSRGSIITARLLVLDNRVRHAVLGGMGADFTNPEWPRRMLFYKALMGESVPELASMVNYVRESKLDQQALAYMQLGQPSTSKEALSKNMIPVLVLCGDHDEDNGSSRALADMITNATYQRIPGDHNNTARSQAFSDHVLAFIKKK